MAIVTTSTEAVHGHAVRRFLRHLLEMTAAMMLGMAAYAALFAAAGGDPERVRLDRPELFAFGMAASMSVPMVLWMRRRGHGPRACAEMTAAMVVPALALIACFRLGAVEAGSICPLACATMIPAMAVAMLYRRAEYTGR